MLTIMWNVLHHKKAFDCVRRKELRNRLEKISVSTHLVAVIYNLCANSKTVVIFHNTDPSPLEPIKGVRQVRILSPTVLDIYGKYIRASLVS